MILEYLFFNKNIRESVEKFNTSTLSIEKYKNDKLKIVFKDFEGAEYWAVRYEYGKNSESDALCLSELNEDFISQFSPVTLINESAEFFNKKLYPLVNKFERLLRKFLFLRVAMCDEAKFEHIIKDIESKDFGEIYNILFVDSKFCKDVREKIKNAHTKFDMLQILEESKETTAWDILASEDKLSLIKDNFDVLKLYRNDVMHAHNIGETTYKKAKNLFNDANLQLEQEINKLIEFTYTYHNSEEHTKSLYEKLIVASENASKINTGMIKVMEMLNNNISTVLTPEKIDGIEKTIELLIEAFSKNQDNESNQNQTKENDSRTDSDDNNE